MSGIVGIRSNKSILEQLYYSLSAIQHRGQDSVGVVISDGKSLDMMKASGLVNDLFCDCQITDENAQMGIGHVRSAPQACNYDYNIEPLLSFIKNNKFSIAHDGNLINYNLLKENLEKEGLSFHTHTDSELILLLITRYYEGDIVNAIRKTMQIIKGSYSCVICMQDKIIAFRDYYAFRPLMIGSDGDDFVIASENAALEILDIYNYRDIKSGEIVVIDKDGFSSYPSDINNNQKHCIFEYIYTARPDANIDNVNSYTFRKACGQILYKQAPIEADLVCPVPDSGIASAIGYSTASGIPLAQGLVKNRYVGRSFIKSSQKERNLAVKLKLNPQKSVIDGKSIILVDDSIVRGTTSAKIIKRMRKFGAKEVHFRVSSPPFTYPCYYGIDTPDKADLIASKLSIEQIRDQIGADSLEFISLDNMLQTLSNPNDYCKACFTGDYPIKKDVL